MLVSLPKCKIAKDIEFNFSLNEVYFVLENGVDKACCVMKAKTEVEKFDCCQGGDYQNSAEVEFKFLVVSDTEVTIEESDFSIVEGQKIELTESQIEYLNELLKEEMVRV